MTGLGEQGLKETWDKEKSRKYQERNEKCQAGIEAAAASCQKVSRGRMAVFLLAGLCLYGGSQWHLAFYAGAAACLACFLRFIQRHSQLEEEQEGLRDSQAVAQDYLARFGDGWKRFPVDGEPYLREDFPEARDLDLFGKQSLYQYICTAGTAWGQDSLALWLREPGGAPEMKARQQAVAELAQKEAFSWNMEVCARRIRNVGYQEAKAQMDGFFHSLEKEGRPSKIRKGMGLLLPAAAFASLLFGVAGIYRQPAAACFLACVMVQFFAACACYGQNHRLLSPVYKMAQVIEPYRRLLALLEQQEFESPYLRTLQQRLRYREGASAQERNSASVEASHAGRPAAPVEASHAGRPAASGDASRAGRPAASGKPSRAQGGIASKAFQELEGIVGSIITSHNPYGFALCNGLYLHDFHCVERYMAWKGKYQEEILGWLKAVGEVEALVSLGVLSRTKQRHTLPEIEEVPYPVFAVSDVSHPLIQEPGAVGNDIELKHKVAVITGSNMSGKTTFMRSIGVNLALAYAGGFCTAQGMRVSPMKIRTSMRTGDDVNAGISTFYAELLRIKRMIQESEKHEPMISFIDEIYKGTNSADRIFAARETVRKLSQPDTFTLLTTHDFELCDLESDREADAENYYFMEHYEQDNILFDYKIRKGRCPTRNARYLLRMAGILGD